MKIEAVITVWDDGVFKLRDIIESDNTSSIREQFELCMDNIERKLVEIDESKRKIYDDDDIPF